MIPAFLATEMAVSKLSPEIILTLTPPPISFPITSGTPSLRSSYNPKAHKKVKCYSRTTLSVSFKKSLFSLLILSHSERL